MSRRARAFAAILAVTVLVAGAVAGSGAARPGGATGSALRCGGALKPGVVAGKFRCLRIGQRCSAARQADYRRSGLACRSGRLRVKLVRRVGVASGASRVAPVPLGRPAALGNGWTMSVTNVQADATNALLAADPGNKPPGSGLQYVLVSVDATYTGAASSHLSPASSLRAAEGSNAVYSMYNSYCGTLPAPNLDLDNPLVFPGGSVSGYAACWAVPKEEVGSLVMVYAPPHSRTRVWFSLR
jgi:hypothetical protein